MSVFTKESIKKVIEMWPTNTLNQIAAAVGVSRGSIEGLAKAVRKNGGEHLLPKKPKFNGNGGYLKALVEEILHDQATN